MVTRAGTSLVRGTCRMIRSKRHDREPDARDGDGERRHRCQGTARWTFAPPAVVDIAVGGGDSRCLLIQEKVTPHKWEKVQALSDLHLPEAGIDGGRRAGWRVGPSSDRWILGGGTIA